MYNTFYLCGYVFNLTYVYRIINNFVFRKEIGYPFKIPKTELVYYKIYHNVLDGIIV